MLKKVKTMYGKKKAVCGNLIDRVRHYKLAKLEEGIIGQTLDTYDNVKHGVNKKLGVDDTSYAPTANDTMDLAKNTLAYNYGRLAVKHPKTLQRIRNKVTVARRKIDSVANGDAFRAAYKRKNKIFRARRVNKVPTELPDASLLPPAKIKDTVSNSPTKELDKLSNSLKNDSILGKPRRRTNTNFSPGFTGKMMGAGLAVGAFSAWKNKKIRQGYNDRMAQYDAMESEAPMSRPNLRPRTDLVAPSTSTAIDRNTRSPMRKLRPTGGLYRGKKPFASVGPKKSNVAPSAKMSQVSQQDLIGQRAAEYRQSMSSINMLPSVSTPTKLPLKKSPQKAKEVAKAFIGNLLEAKFRYVSESRMKDKLGSKANIDIRKGTPVRHTFRTNDKKYTFSGRPLAMRQKILSEHKRKGFALHPNFANLSPAEIATNFDYLSDQGMLEDRDKLDPSYFDYGKRKIKRVVGRTGRRIKSFFGDLLKTKKSKTKESDVADTDKDFCDFEVGNVKYPEDCNCSSCKKLLETAGTSFGQLLQGDKHANTSPIEETTPQKLSLITHILKKRKRKKRRRFRESFEDIKYRDNLNRELLYHGMNPEPKALFRRRNTYFNLTGTLSKLDRLGMNVAMAAIALNGLNPFARKMMAKHGKSISGFIQDVKRAAANAKAKFRESVFSDVDAEEARYKKMHPYIHAFLDSPLNTSKKAAKAAVIKLGKKGSLSPHYIYPAAVLAGGAVTAGALYGGKQFIYDPMKRRAIELKKKLALKQKQLQK